MYPGNSGGGLFVIRGGKLRLAGICHALLQDPIKGAFIYHISLFIKYNKINNLIKQKK